jgi:hypothetical protein
MVKEMTPEERKKRELEERTKHNSSVTRSYSLLGKRGRKPKPDLDKQLEEIRKAEITKFREDILRVVEEMVNEKKEEDK